MSIRSMAVAFGVGLAVVAATVAPALAATPYDEARALLEHAAHLEGQADDQRELSALIYDAELKKAEALDDQAALRFQLAQEAMIAGLRDEARARIEQALGLAGQADDAREIAALIYDAELSKADALHEQAALRRRLAQATFEQAGFSKEARAAGLRLEGHLLRFASHIASDRSTFADRLATAASDRARLLRQTARVVRQSSPDAALLEYASRMEQQRDADREAAHGLSRQARALGRESTTSGSKADKRFGSAERLDPGGV